MNLTDAGTGGISTRIPIDSIESVDVDMTGYSAEYGKGSGGVVRVNSNFIQDRFRWNLTDFVPGVNWKKLCIEVGPSFSRTPGRASSTIRGTSRSRQLGRLRDRFPDKLPGVPRHQETSSFL